MRKIATGCVIAWLIMCAVGAVAWADEASSTASAVSQAAAAVPIDSGHTTWVLISTALVMLMTPGLAFFYGGLVRRKNILSVLMQCFMIMCIVSIQWVVLGYSMAFGRDISGLIGNLDWMWLKGVGMESSSYAPGVPHQAFVLFQMMFAVITPALIIGTFAERMRFSAFCLFSLLWAVFVYDPVAHWIWGKGGFLGCLGGMGAVDFAGGMVVHVNAGMAALAAALFLGKRRGYPDSISPPHNLPFAALGAGLLWFGWFGFNAGSALQANGIAVSAFMATHIAGCVAGVTWSILDWMKFGKPTTLGMITGAVAGLAAVTPASGFVDLTGAMWIGLGSGIICWISVTFAKARFKYDDTLDAFGVHGVGGIWGSLAVGMWATKAVNAGGVNGLLHGNPMQLLIQAKAVLVTMIYSFVVSAVLFKFVDMVATLRVSDHEERVGLDLTQHKESGYTLLD
jgi:Amt family ammonium transporter